MATEEGETMATEEGETMATERGKNSVGKNATTKKTPNPEMKQDFSASVPKKNNV
jgi:hypothetical protein